MSICSHDIERKRNSYTEISDSKTHPKWFKLSQLTQKRGSNFKVSPTLCIFLCNAKETTRARQGKGVSVGLHERIFLGPVILFCGKLNPYLQLVQCMGHLFTYRVYAKKDGSVETVCHIIMAARLCDNYQKKRICFVCRLRQNMGRTLVY